jgi:hypothetical protein
MKKSFLPKLSNSNNSFLKGQKNKSIGSSFLAGLAALRWMLVWER